MRTPRLPFRLRLVVNRNGLSGQLVAGGVGNVAIKAIQILLAVVLSAVLARSLGPGEYGVYAYVFTLVSVLVIPAQFGLTKLIIRETAVGQAVGNPGIIYGIWSWSLIVGLISTVAVAGLGLVVLLFLHARLSAEEFAVCLSGVALVPLMTFARLVSGALRGLRHVVLGQLPDVVFRPGSFLVLVLLTIWWGGSRLTAARAMELHMAAGVVSLVAAITLLSRKRPAREANQKRIFQTRAWLAAIIPFLWINGAQQVNLYTDILMLGVFRSKEEVGFYRVAVQAGLVAAVGLQSVKMLVQPYIARFHKQGDRQRLARLLKASSRGATGAALAVFVVLAVAGKPLITMIFGSAYIGCYIPLLILTAGQLIASFFGVADFVLEMTGHQKASLRALVVGASCNVVLNLWLIPRHGLIGAAIATTSSLLVWNILLWLAVRRRLGLDTRAFGRTCLAR